MCLLFPTAEPLGIQLLLASLRVLRVAKVCSLSLESSMALSFGEHLIFVYYVETQSAD